MDLGLPGQNKGLWNIAIIAEDMLMSKEKPHETKCQETTLKNKQRGEGDDGSVGEVLDAKTGVLNSYTHIQYKKKSWV